MITNITSGKSVTPVLILLAVIVSLGIITSTPFILQNSLRVENEFSQEKLKRLKIQTGNLSRIVQSGRQSDGVAGKQGEFLLTGTTTGIAGANLQKLITRIVARHNGNARSFQILTPEKEKDLTRIALNLNMEIELGGLQKILFDLETGTPFVFVEEMVIETAANRDNPLQKQSLLRINLKISGYLLNNNKT